MMEENLSFNNNYIIQNCKTITEYLCHKQQRICSVCNNHNQVIFELSFMTYHRICKHINSNVATSGVVNPSGAPEFTPVLVGLLLLNLHFLLFVPLFHHNKQIKTIDHILFKKNSCSVKTFCTQKNRELVQVCYQQCEH